MKASSRWGTSFQRVVSDTLVRICVASNLHSAHTFGMLSIPATASNGAASLGAKSAGAQFHSDAGVTACFHAYELLLAQPAPALRPPLHPATLMSCGWGEGLTW